MLGKGYVQVYTGAGKGKTTAAFGLALRAAGHGLRTYIGQFMKGQMYGELQALRDHSLIEIEQYGDARCVRRDEVTPEHVAQARRGLERASEQMCSGRFDIVVLDGPSLHDGSVPGGEKAATIKAMLGIDASEPLMAAIGRAKCRLSERRRTSGN